MKIKNDWPHDEIQVELEQQEDETTDEYLARIEEYEQQQEEMRAEYLIDEREEREYD